MAELFHYILNTKNYQNHELYYVIDREFNNEADKEFAYHFFDKYKRLPDAKELGYA